MFKINRKHHQIQHAPESEAEPTLAVDATTFSERSLLNFPNPVSLAHASWCHLIIIRFVAFIIAVISVLDSNRIAAKNHHPPAERTTTVIISGLRVEFINESFHERRRRNEVSVRHLSLDRSCGFGLETLCSPKEERRWKLAFILKTQLVSCDFILDNLFLMLPWFLFLFTVISTNI